MRRIYRISLYLAVTAAVMLAIPAVSPAAGMGNASGETAVQLPAVQLKHWQNSTQNERYAFLIGLFSMMEMERVWQGKEALPIYQSIIGSWARGISGKTLQDINDGIDRYFLEHPDQAEKPVLEVLGILYIKPALSSAERSAAAARYAEVKEDWESRERHP